MDSNIKIKKGQIEDYAVQLTGTEPTKPITGDLELSGDNISMFKENSKLEFTEDNTVRLINDDGINKTASIRVTQTEVTNAAADANGETTLTITPTGITLNAELDSKGISSPKYYDKQGDSFAYPQMQDLEGIMGSIRIQNVLDNGYEGFSASNNSHIKLPLADNLDIDILKVSPDNSESTARFSLGVNASQGEAHLGAFAPDGGVARIQLNAHIDQGIYMESSNYTRVNNKNIITSINGEEANDAGEITIPIGVNEESFIQKSTTYTPIHNLIGLTQIEYDAIEEKDATTIYFIQ